MRARFIGGPLDGELRDIEPCSYYQVAIRPDLPDIYSPNYEPPPVRSMVYLPCGIGDGCTIFRPEGTFRTDGKPSDPRRN